MTRGTARDCGRCSVRRNGRAPIAQSSASMSASLGSSPIQKVTPERLPSRRFHRQLFVPGINCQQSVRIMVAGGIGPLRSTRPAWHNRVLSGIPSLSLRTSLLANSSTSRGSENCPQAHSSSVSLGFPNGLAYGSRFPKTQPTSTLQLQLVEYFIIEPTWFLA
jgi:hypothetical protein